MFGLSKTLALLTSLSALACSSGLHSRRPPRGALTARGTLYSVGPAARAVVRGPGVLYAFASSPRVMFYYASSVHNTDEDCRAPRQGADLARSIRARPDYGRVTLAVKAGEVVCVDTSGRANAELLWRSYAAAPESMPPSIATVH
jgi:hypothetical protein